MNRERSLDLFRAVAIVRVVCYHMFTAAWFSYAFPAMGVMFVSAWSIALVLLALSGWLGQWFGEPAMVPVMRVLALGFVVIPFGSITQSPFASYFATRELT